MSKTLLYLLFVTGLALSLSGCVTDPDALDVESGMGPHLDWTSEDALLVYLSEYPVVYEKPDSFLLEVYFENVGGQALTILPSLIHRLYSPMDEAGAVTYVPIPAAEGSPWSGAFTLQPQQTKVVTFLGMKDGDGFWELQSGFYRLSVRYMVTKDLMRSGYDVDDGFGPPPATLWVGEVQSEEMTVRYEPVAGGAQSGTERPSEEETAKAKSF
jgi:hypothetical protein